LGTALLVAGLYEAAVTELSAAWQADPADTATAVRLARAFVAQKNIPAAGKTLETMVRDGHANGAVYAQLADVYEASGHPENAIPAMRLAIEQEPRNEAFLFRYGMLLTDTNAPQAGIIRLKEAVEKFPQSPRLWLGLGMAQFQDHKNADAEGSFDRAVQLDPHFASALTYLGLIALDAGKFKDAQTLYQRALAEDPKLGILHYLLAEAIQKETEPDLARAEAELRLAIDFDKNFTAAHLDLGKLLVNSGRAEAGLAELQAVVALDPQQAQAYYQLGRAFQRLKKTEEAKAAFDRFKVLSDQEKLKAVEDRKQLLAKLAHVDF
jgi:superkiller protein 3